MAATARMRRLRYRILQIHDIELGGMVLGAHGIIKVGKGKTRLENHKTLLVCFLPVDLDIMFFLYRDDTYFTFFMAAVVLDTRPLC